MRNITTTALFVTMLMFSGCGDNMTAEERADIEMRVKKMTKEQTIPEYVVATLNGETSKAQLYSVKLSIEDIQTLQTQIDTAKSKLEELLTKAPTNKEAKQELINQLRTGKYDISQQWKWYKEVWEPAALKILETKEEK